MSPAMYLEISPGKIAEFLKPPDSLTNFWEIYCRNASMNSWKMSSKNLQEHLHELRGRTAGVISKMFSGGTSKELLNKFLEQNSMRML